MKKVLILVEGQTEETFVKQVLAPYLNGFDIFIIPIIIVTKRVKIGADFKGGVPEYPKVRNEILRLLSDRSANTITTMFDYYGLPSGYPGKDSISDQNPFDKVRIIENAIKNDIQNPKFLPYLSLHEFESLLFSSPSLIAKTLTYPSSETILNNIKSSFNSPEEINDNTETAPSKRLKKIFKNYQKVLHGSLISTRTGLQIIRNECKHFNDWLTKIET